MNAAKIKPAISAGWLATPARLERATFSSAGKRSNPLSYGVVFISPPDYSTISAIMQIGLAPEGAGSIESYRLGMLFAPNGLSHE